MVISRERALRLFRGRGRELGRTPSMGPLVLQAAVAVVAAAGGAVALYLFLAWLLGVAPHPETATPDQQKLLADMVKIALGLAAGVGAAVALIVGYRRARVEEASSHRDDHRLFSSRYQDAAELIGHHKAAVRLAGIYAMARLADDWAEQRQQCIDVLSAYLRLPYDPETSEPGEREVRLTVIRLITAHLQAGATRTWHRHGLDFTGAVFDGGDFRGAEFSSGTVDFSGAKFSGGTVDFTRAEFSGGTVDFTRAEFSGGTVDFSGAKFSGGTVDFTRAEFSGGTVDFSGAEFSGDTENSDPWAPFSGGTVNFGGAVFSGGTVGFRDAKFLGGTVSFGDAVFRSGCNVDFGRVDFNHGTVDFSRAEFSGGTVNFANAMIGFGGTVDLSRAEFSGGTVDFGGASFTGVVTVNIRDAKISAGTLNFSGARIYGGTISFGGFVGYDPMDLAMSMSITSPPPTPTLIGGTVFSGGTVDFSGAEFSGGTVDFSRAVFSSGTVDFSRAAYSGGEVDLSAATRQSSGAAPKGLPEAPPAGLKLSGWMSRTTPDARPPN
ncbi:pentapeptide repeat-containing protein [Kribbella sp. NPDC049174]|uniref:pentapeptide repeat-containing protein n=1 Tax=Kribbella sp. NPDC049174 TaxID=3364112 RepID=UPI00371A5886